MRVEAFHQLLGAPDLHHVEAGPEDKEDFLFFYQCFPRKTGKGTRKEIILNSVSPQTRVGRSQTHVASRSARHPSRRHVE